MDAASFLSPDIDRVVADDIPWILSLAYERYPPFDPGGALTFLLQALQAPTMLLLKHRERSAFLVATRVAPPWFPQRVECHVMGLCARPGAHWQAVRLLRQSLAWARLHGCLYWRFYSETDHDVGALCRRLGAEPETRYVITL